MNRKQTSINVITQQNPTKVFIELNRMDVEQALIDHGFIDPEFNKGLLTDAQVSRILLETAKRINGELSIGQLLYWITGIEIALAQLCGDWGKKNMDYFLCQRGWILNGEMLHAVWHAICNEIHNTGNEPRPDGWGLADSPVFLHMILKKYVDKE